MNAVLGRVDGLVQRSYFLVAYFVKYKAVTSTHAESGNVTSILGHDSKVFNRFNNFLQYSDGEITGVIFTQCEA